MRVLSPAKINLFLHVTGRRPDGYHNLQSLMCCVSLFDRLKLTWQRRGIDIHCSHAAVPTDAANLAYQAAQRFFHTTGQAGGVAISIDKKIPVAAGLGGGSSNAAAVLKALNQHFGQPLSERALMDLGRELGADVPFLIYGLPALASGIGERLTPCPGLTPYHVVLVFPGFPVSTAEIYQGLNLGLTKREKEPKNFNFKKYTFDPRDHLHNDLEAVTQARYPKVLEAKQALRRQDALGVLMSGSGPTVFGLFPDQPSAHKAREQLQRIAPWRTFAAHLLT